MAQVVSTLHCLRTVTSCFPVAEGPAESFTASEEESALLRRLAVQQLKAERSARAAVAASKRAVLGFSGPSGYQILPSSRAALFTTFAPKSFTKIMNFCQTYNVGAHYMFEELLIHLNMGRAILSPGAQR